MMQTGNSQSNVQTRPHGCIDLEKLGVPSHRIGEIAGMIIGKSGSGIRRYTSAVNGSFVKLQTTKAVSTDQTRADLGLCRFVYISARTIQDVQKLAVMVNRDIVHHLHGCTVQPSRPTLNVNAPLQREIVGFVIGSNGDNLKRIQRFVGDECFIVYDGNSNIFRITANTTNACRLAQCRIGDSIREFSQRTKKHQTQVVQPQVPRSNIGSRYECIAEESNSDDEDSASVTSSLLEQSSSAMADAVLPEEQPVRDQTKPSKKDRKKMRRARQLENQLFDNSSVSSNGSIANIRAEDQERKIVRENLSKTCNRAGNLQYPAVDFWDNKTRRWVKLTGAAAVPWKDVDQEISRRQTTTQLVRSRNTPEQVWQPDTDINPANQRSLANGCWSSPSTNLWDSIGVDQINAEEYNQRMYKTNSRRNTQDQYYDYEIPLDLQEIELDQYYNDTMDLTYYDYNAN